MREVTQLERIICETYISLASPCTRIEPGETRCDKPNTESEAESLLEC
jgi:hypothetical protein